jgi:hypothetical protein
MVDTLITAFATSGLLLLALRFLAGNWIATRLKESISAEYQRALEQFKGELGWRARRKEQAAQIAELVSIFIRILHVPREEANALRAELQSKYWALALWLDAPTLRELNKAFIGAGEPGLQHKIALIQVRKLLVGQDDDIAPGELYHWDPLPPIPPATEVPSAVSPPNPALNPTGADAPAG